jgi:hypothetical protein
MCYAAPTLADNRQLPRTDKTDEQYQHTTTDNQQPRGDKKNTRKNDPQCLNCNKFEADIDVVGYKLELNNENHPTMPIDNR